MIMAHTRDRSGTGSVSTRQSSPLREKHDLWFVPHPQIRTKAARERAIQLADQLQSDWAGAVLDERVLFVALHTAAYQASRLAERNQSSSAARGIWVARWKTLRACIVERNLGLAYSMMARFRARVLSEDDLQSEALFALWRAADRFDPWQGYRFSTYACNVIARAVMRRCKREHHYRQVFPVQHEPCHEKPETGPDVNADFYLERLKQIRSDNLGELTDLESRIISHRYPLESQPQLTYQQIGAAVGLSKERVRQIQKVALHKLRRALTGDPVLR